VGADLFHADGQTDMSKITVAFRSFANASKNHKSAKKIRGPTVCQRFISVGQQHAPCVVDVGIRRMPKSDTAVPYTLDGQMFSDFHPTHFRALSDSCHVISKASALFFTGVPTKIHRMCSVNCIDTGDIQLGITDRRWNDRVHALLLQTTGNNVNNVVDRELFLS
jgi:hypothetical protein